GIKGRLRRALSLSAAQTINEEASSSATGGTSGSMASGLTGAGDTGDAASTATKTTKKKSRTALFNSRLNASTDNISLSSTMSSASVVIRKLGSIGKLARRNSLAGITSLFKDKKEREDVEAEAAPAASSSKKDKGKKKKGEKGSIVEPSVSQINGEIDRQSSDWGDQLTGLSPAAELARRHTLKTNAAEAEAAKARVEETAAKARVEETAAVSGDPVPTTWEKNTTTRAGGHIPPGAAYRVNEEGVRVLVEDDDSGSEGHGETWDDEDWSRLEGVDEDDEEADVTIRQGLERGSVDEDDAEPWGVGLRRSVERTRQPARGILKNAGNYDQHVFMEGVPGMNLRARSNSYNSPAGAQPELGPLAHISSSDPDHIDGLHRHGSLSSAHGGASFNGPAPTPTFLPPLSFETESPAQSDTETDEPRTKEKSLFTHPALNSSAPVLSSMLTVNNVAPTLTHRAATSPAKRLAFASNLSVYDTFPATVYDRRSEPATWSRLTPQLAQRIKEELNSFKMEEMEVHAASRIQCVYLV
ncbi:hypothetical protein OF83DRAFT_1028044, partial [Amylostereum chailletii]